MKKYILILLALSNMAYGARFWVEDPVGPRHFAVEPVAPEGPLDDLIAQQFPRQDADVHLAARMELEEIGNDPPIVIHAIHILEGTVNNIQDIKEFMHTIASLEAILGGITPPFIRLTQGMDLTTFRACAGRLAEENGLIAPLAEAIPGHATPAQRGLLIQALADRPQATWAGEIARILPPAAAGGGVAGFGAGRAAQPPRAAGRFGGFDDGEGGAAVGAPPRDARAYALAEIEAREAARRGKNIHAEGRVEEINNAAFKFFEIMVPFLDQIKTCAYSRDKNKYEYLHLLALEDYIRNRYVQEEIQLQLSKGVNPSLAQMSCFEATRDAALWVLFAPLIQRFDAAGGTIFLPPEKNNDLGPLLGERYLMFDGKDADLSMATLWWFINNVNTPRGYKLPQRPTITGKTPQEISRGLRLDLVLALKQCIDDHTNNIPPVAGNSRVCQDGKGNRLIGGVLRGILPEAGEERGTTVPLSVRGTNARGDTTGDISTTLATFCKELPKIVRAKGEALKRIEIRHFRTGELQEVTEQPTRAQFLDNVDTYLGGLNIKPTDYLLFRQQFLEELGRYLESDTDLSLKTIDLTGEDIAEGRNRPAWNAPAEAARPAVVPHSILATADAAEAARVAERTRANPFDRVASERLWDQQYRPLTAYQKQVAADGKVFAGFGAEPVPMPMPPAPRAGAGGPPPPVHPWMPVPPVPQWWQIPVPPAPPAPRAGAGGPGVPAPAAAFGLGRAGAGGPPPPAHPWMPVPVPPAPIPVPPAHLDAREAEAQGRLTIDHLPEQYRAVAREKFATLGGGDHRAENAFAVRIRGYLEQYPHANATILRKNMKGWR